MRRHLIAAAALLVFLGAVSAAPREINVTADSAPGWIPTVEQDDMAQKAARAYLAAEYSGDTAAAYAAFTDLNKQHLPYPRFESGVKEFVAKAGPVTDQRVVKITWTKDPADAPFPGVYAAMDLASRFAHIDRHCGYVVLYQAPEGGPFLVMREEANSIDNDTFASIVREHDQAYADRVWAQLSSNCPNFPGH